MRMFRPSFGSISLREHRLIAADAETPAAAPATPEGEKPKEAPEGPKSPETMERERVEKATADMTALKQRVEQIQNKITALKSVIGTNAPSDEQKTQMNTLEGELATAQRQLDATARELEPKPDRPKTLGQATMDEFNAAARDLKSARNPDGSLDKGKAFAAMMRFLAAVGMLFKNISQWNKPASTETPAAPGADGKGPDGKGKESPEAPASVEKFKKYMKEGKAYGLEGKDVSTHQKLAQLQDAIISGTEDGPKKKLDSDLRTKKNVFTLQKNAADTALNRARAMPESTADEKKAKSDAIDEATKKVKELEDKWKKIEEEEKKLQGELDGIKKERDGLKSVVESKDNEAQNLQKKFAELQSKLSLVDPTELEDQKDKDAYEALEKLNGLKATASDKLEAPIVDKTFTQDEFGQLMRAVQLQGIASATDGPSVLGLELDTGSSEYKIVNPETLHAAVTKLHAKWVEKKPAA